MDDTHAALENAHDKAKEKFEGVSAEFWEGLNNATDTAKDKLDPNEVIAYILGNDTNINVENVRGSLRESLR